ncbi:MAG TPA: septum site-determining protein MinC [Bacillota bacterium]|nr:septum site-determining protein MinC [Bacillota bacterium]
MPETNQLIALKGTKEGLTLFINEKCSLEDAYVELEQKLIEDKPKGNDPIVPVIVQFGHRYVDEGEKHLIKNMIEKHNRFSVESFESRVVLKEEALRWKEESETTIVHRVIRSGQVLDVEGDVLLIGDVNPGGKIAATGNIYIMGKLHGVAHSGTNGDEDSFIAASYMEPSQLRIAHYISRAPDYETEGVYMECGVIDKEQDKIVIDHLNVLANKNRRIGTFERRMNHE